jgi:hypothetical protein
MTSMLSRSLRARRARITVPLTALAFTLASCSHGSSGTTVATAPSRGGYDMSTRAPSPDPRVGLRAGAGNTAASAIWNMKHVSNTPSTGKFAGVTNSDLAFIEHYAIQGNYSGYQVWDIANPAAPMLADSYFCPASQSDVSVYNNLLFVSSESTTGRLDCGAGGTDSTTANERIRGVRVFDATDMTHPKYLANVQSCRGSHTHTVVNDPNDPNNVYIYISGTSGVRPANELAGCENLAGTEASTSLFNIEVIKVPLAHPDQAAIVSHAHIFQDEKTGAFNGLASPKAHGQSPLDTGAAGRAGRGGGRGGFAALTLTPTSTRADSMRAQAALDSLKKAGVVPATTVLATVGAGRGGRGGGARPPNPGAGFLTQCHDITVYPAIGLAGGACAGMGLLLDIHDTPNPKRIDAYADSNFSFWHSATFSNDGSKVLFSDEWGGGGAAYCRKGDPMNWGGDALFKIVNKKLVFQSYYKMPAPQTKFENCVAHNGSLIPIPGRDILVQSWYQGGISIFDWTDAAHPHEIAFFDRGPNDSTRLASGGFWSSYWYNGYIVASEIQRGLDIFELQPSGFISQNEIDAAKSVKFKFLNVQDQPRFVWPASPALSGAYLDQLERSKGLSNGNIASARADLAKAVAASGGSRSAMLTALATKLDTESGAAADRAKVQLLAQSVRDLAKM